MISWENQWELFAPNFKDGKARIDLSSLPPVYLFAGPGFGDGSHPTTQLMLKAMEKYVPGKTVVDIGCGSGILSFGAAHMGAGKIYGIDIEQDALAHAEKNKALNLHPEKITFSRSLPAFSEPVIVLMNMIPAEQLMAWQAQPHLSNTPKIVLTSGILDEKRDEYLAWASSQGWSLIGEASLGPWLQFSFA